VNAIATPVKTSVYAVPFALETVRQFGFPLLARPFCLSIVTSLKPVALSIQPRIDSVPFSVQALFDAIPFAIHPFLDPVTFAIPSRIDSVPSPIQPSFDAIPLAVLPFLDAVTSTIKSALNPLPRIIFTGIRFGYRKTDQNTTQNKDNSSHFSPPCHQRLERVLYLLKRTRPGWVDMWGNLFLTFSSRADEILMGDQVE
jgi:hypothetical protein